jgi:NAD(P)-dependent dehydrogenase (short-subunit alcohol dehydrogenase family)
MGRQVSKGMSWVRVHKQRNSGSAVPLGRLDTPMDIGCSVASLSSDEADYITGQA